MKKENSEKKIQKQTLTTENFLDYDSFNKRLLMCCVLSAGVAVVIVFIMLKVGLNYHDKQIDELCENYATIDTRIKAMNDSIIDLSSAMENLRSDWKLGKDSSTYIYTTLSALQKDISIIKNQLHLNTENSDDSLKKLPSTKSAFIESFENLIEEGVPFDSFLDSYNEKIDMKKYQTSENLLSFSKLTIKSLSDLKKDITAIGYKLFQTKVSESFWEKQKRVIKEKISSIIKIKTKGKEDSALSEISTDKQKFELAGKLLSDGEIAQSLGILEEIKIEDEDLGELIQNIRKRLDLQNSFFEFKKEFMNAEISTK